LVNRKFVNTINNPEPSNCLFTHKSVLTIDIGPCLLEACTKYKNS